MRSKEILLIVWPDPFLPKIRHGCEVEIRKAGGIIKCSPAIGTLLILGFYLETRRIVEEVGGTIYAIRDARALDELAHTRIELRAAVGSLRATAPVSIEAYMTRRRVG